jgi:hypothetical protein
MPENDSASTGLRQLKTSMAQLFYVQDVKIKLNNYKFKVLSIV